MNMCEERLRVGSVQHTTRRTLCARERRRRRGRAAVGDHLVLSATRRTPTASILPFSECSTGQLCTVRTLLLESDWESDEQTQHGCALLARAIRTQGHFGSCGCPSSNDKGRCGDNCPCRHAARQRCRPCTTAPCSGWHFVIAIPSSSRHTSRVV